MDILDQRSLALIPQPIRWIVLAFLALATLLSAGFAIWLTVAHGSDALAVALLSIFKASAIGTALWFFFLIGQRAQSRGDLLKLTGHILKSEIPASIESYATIDFMKAAANARANRVPTRAELHEDYALADNYVSGTTRVDYMITRWPGSAGTGHDIDLKLHVHLNVRKVDIVYYFASPNEARAGDIVARLIIGAREAKWSFGDTKTELDTTHTMPECYRTSVMASLTLEHDFLHDTTERLFIANDIAAMTQYLVHLQASPGA